MSSYVAPPPRVWYQAGRHHCFNQFCEAEVARVPNLASLMKPLVNNYKQQSWVRVQNSERPVNTSHVGFSVQIVQVNDIGLWAAYHA